MRNELEQSSWDWEYNSANDEYRIFAVTRTTSTAQSSVVSYRFIASFKATRDKQRDIAVAKLLAAAPNLFQASEKVVTEGSTFHESRGNADEAIAMCEQALAKATSNREED